MSARSFFRAIGWLTAELWPAQFVDAMRERDYRVGAEWDAAEALAEAEAETEVWAPLGERYCASRQPGKGYICTRRVGHSGDHGAGFDHEVFDTWPQESSFAGAASQCLGCGDVATDSHVCLRADPADSHAAGSSGGVGSLASAPTLPPPSPLPTHSPEVGSDDDPAGALPPEAPAGSFHSPSPDVGSPNDIIQIALHRTEHIPGGGWVGYSDDFPDKQFLIVPKK